MDVKESLHVVRFEQRKIDGYINCEQYSTLMAKSKKQHIFISLLFLITHNDKNCKQISTCAELRNGHHWHK